ncbi:MAG: SDR family oxidoreductase [Anaerolineales bacterium]|nr:SDR family oxidoreductase [Anaerolineales bacterium]
MALVDRTALVTGASGQGIGRAVAWKLGEMGAVVGLNYKSDQTGAVSLAEEMQEKGLQSKIVYGDVSTRQGAIRLCHKAENILGPIDILVNNAGYWVEKPLLDTTDDEWDRMINTDLRGAFLTIRTLAPSMIKRRWGRIINISSISGLNSIEGEGVYGVAKAGLNMLTKSFGVDLGKYGITVNAIAPGWTLPLGESYPPEPEDYAQCAAVPNQRPGHAKEVGELAGFLVSEDASHINAQVLCIDGGHSSILLKGR